MIWFILAFVFILLLVTLMSTKLNINIQYYHHSYNDLLTISVKLWAMHIYTFSSPLMNIEPSNLTVEIDEQSNSPLGNKKDKKTFDLKWLKEKLILSKDFLEHVQGFYKISRRFLKKWQVHNLEWKSEIATGDAVLTGMLAAGLWSVKSLFVGVTSQFVTLKRMPILHIQPVYQGKFTKTDFSCMFSFRIGQAIIAGLLIVKHWRSMRNKKTNISSSANHSI
ncbi:DUF2953 domain-containing protein [Alkalihalobacillus trypoxylicola]|uniref:DUF2953 domain-containing protein n=1 Tax=Alkalihalobacillus trypoxylicola TaxID=519424 RepID=A0A162EAQ2_9BACI|nr:DUF2953 domain-containing protein [Alkalihalobacillus trypoxylicola]KYG32171.1 hypothetical protein AZF04_05240 [Alkalihalobacillus trypoxylicola]